MKSILSKLFVVSVLAFFCAVLNPVRAQSGKVWSIGPELGVNLSKFGRDAPENDMKAGVVAGFFVTYSIVDHFGVTAKFLLSQRGGQITANGVTNKTALNYIEVPVLGRFFLNRSGKFRPNLFVGPSLNFLMGGTNKVGDADAVKISDYKDIYNTFDLGLTGGLGLNYEIANETRILLDARYVYGLSDISKAGGNINNQTINISAGIQFGF
jgi:outer membrane protein W